MNKTTLSWLLTLGYLTCNTVNASVLVTVGESQYKYESSPRLVEILTPVATREKWYWPSAALYKTNNVKLEECRKLVLQNIVTLIKRYQAGKPDLAYSLEELHTTIAHWHLARRLPIPIDYDLTRISAEKNPQLTQGNYILQLTPRKNTIYVFGAINKTANILHQAHADISQYITNQTRTDLTDKDYVMLIQADGRIIRVPIAYWNKSHHEAMPGSQIFIPFKQSFLPPTLANINQQIITLALNRVHK